MVYTVSREDAAKILGISTRTVDRYISSGKIRSKRDGKTVLLHEDDVRRHQAGGEQKDYEVIDAPKPMTVATTDYDARTGHNEIMHAIQNVIREKDAVIQELTFKIGKIEGELVNSIPKPEHRKTLLALEEANHNRIRDIEQLTHARSDMETKLKKERLVSTALLIALFILFVAGAFLVFQFLNLQDTVQYTI